MMRHFSTPSGRAWVAPMLLAIAVGCGSPRDGSMVQVSPPGDWDARIATLRSEREDFFRTSPDSPLPPDAVDSFAGLQFWELDPELYFIGELHPYPVPERFDIPTTSGRKRPCQRYGWIRFRIEGEPHTLQVYRLLDMGPGVESFLLPFRDGTSGAETYPAGRYVELEGPIGGPYVLDLNRAYNPSCAYGDAQRFACPVTPPENRLAVRIEAGERGYAMDAPEAGGG